MIKVIQCPQPVLHLKYHSPAADKMSSQKKVSIICVVICAFCFGTMEIALKIGAASFTPLQITFLRFLLGGIVLLPFALVDLKRRAYHLTKSDWAYLTILAVTGMCVSMTLCQTGLLHSNANTAAVIICSNPVFTMIFAHFLVNDRFTKRKALVLVLSLLGMIFVSNPMDMAEGNTPEGIICVFVAAVLFGLFSAIGKKRVAVLGGMVQNSFSFLIGAVLMLIGLVATGQPVAEGITVSTLPVLLYAGIVVTGLGYWSYLKAIELAGPSFASVAFFIKPVIACIFSAIILSEEITWTTVLGVILVLVGSIINMRK